MLLPIVIRVEVNEHLRTSKIEFSKLVQVSGFLNFMLWCYHDLNETILLIFNLNWKAHNLLTICICFSLEWIENMICQIVLFPTVWSSEHSLLYFLRDIILILCPSFPAPHRHCHLVLVKEYGWGNQFEKLLIQWDSAELIWNSDLKKNKKKLLRRVMLRHPPSLWFVRPKRYFSK